MYVYSLPITTSVSIAIYYLQLAQLFHNYSYQNFLTIFQAIYMTMSIRTVRAQRPETEWMQSETAMQWVIELRLASPLPRLIKKSGAKILPMNWHCILALSTRTIVLMEKSKSLLFGIFHSRQYAARATGAGAKCIAR